MGSLVYESLFCATYYLLMLKKFQDTAMAAAILVLTFQSFLLCSFGKRVGGAARRHNECLILEHSEMIVVSYS